MDQASWISGYLAGIRAAGGGAVGSAQAPAAAHGPELTILVGSQTGNGEGVAEEACRRALARGLKATVKNMGSYKLPQLKNEKNLLVIVSTHGEGDPPDNAKEMSEFLTSKRAPKLAGTHFSVLGLGDSSYTHFCKMGKDFDERLAALGATRVFDRADCDVDYEDASEAWMDGAIAALAEKLDMSSAPTAAVVGSFVSPPTGQFSKRNPFPAEVLDNIVLNGRGSSKETHHIELSLEGSGFTYEPGDAVGVYPVNCREVAGELIQTLNLDPDEPVPVKDDKVPLREALERHYEVTTLTRPMMQKYNELVGSKKLAKLLDESNLEAYAAYTDGREIIDLLQDFPGKGIKAAEFVGTLRKLPPRLYSIASSMSAHPDEVHLTVVAVRYTANGRDRKGVASTYFAERLGEDDKVPVYIDHNKNFKMPVDATAPMIMIGPGTGVAPFRSFMAEREATGATGRNWLFYGDQHFLTDFMYQIEWQDYLKSGLLTRMDVAFSRDQEQKIYVQNRMTEQGRDIYGWLEEGAHVYVCGDEKRMAPDVHQALLDIIHKHGGKSKDAAEEYLNTMHREKRYQRDIY